MNQVLITGGDGYLGRRLARRYIRDSDLEVVLAVRARDADELTSKKASLGAFLGHSSRLHVVPVDLSADEALAGFDLRRVQTIIHTAAVTRFNVDEETARSTNIEGTVRLLELAERCPDLAHFALLSTVYSSGLTPGRIGEEPQRTEHGFANYYEWSKHESESILMSRFGHLPWSISRVATVIADADDGCVSQYNAFHNTLKLYYYGLLSLLPGRPETPLYFVTGRFATDAIYDIATGETAAGFYHVAHRCDESASLDDLIATAFEAFQHDLSFRRRRLLRPVYADLESFDIFTEGVGAFASSAVTQALGSVTPFARQLYVRKEIANDRLRAVAPNQVAPDPVELVRRTVEHLLATRWGRVTPSAA